MVHILSNRVRLRSREPGRLLGRRIPLQKVPSRGPAVARGNDGLGGSPGPSGWPGDGLAGEALTPEARDDHDERVRVVHRQAHGRLDGLGDRAMIHQ